MTDSSVKIHSFAQVHPKAELGEGVEIGPWCQVGEKVKIGAFSRLVSHVIVDGSTTLGARNTIYPFAVLGSVPQDLKYQGEDTKLVIGNDNNIREGVTISLGTVLGGGVTSIGNHCLIMGYTHIGHDCRIGNHCIIANYGGFAGHVYLEDFVTVGGMSGISQFVRLGEYSYIGGYSGIEKDVPPYTIALGTRPTFIKSANIVKLKRQGFDSEKIQKINEVIKLWVRPEVQKEACLRDIKEKYSHYPEVQKFIDFVNRSKNGVIRTVASIIE